MIESAQKVGRVGFACDDVNVLLSDWAILQRDKGIEFRGYIPHPT